MLAIQAFHDDEALGMPDSALSSYVYGVDATTTPTEDGGLSIEWDRLDEHVLGGKTIPSSFFDQPDTEHISAVLFSNVESEVTLVEVKHFAPHRCVGVGIVRALYGVKALRGAPKAMLVTISYVSNYARREFSRVIPWELELVERDRILEWCGLYLEHLIQRPLAPEPELESSCE